MNKYLLITFDDYSVFDATEEKLVHFHAKEKYMHIICHLRGIHQCIHRQTPNSKFFDEVTAEAA